MVENKRQQFEVCPTLHTESESGICARSRSYPVEALIKLINVWVFEG